MINNEYGQLTNPYRKPRLAIYVLHNLHVHPIGSHVLILALNSANVLSTLYPQCPGFRTSEERFCSVIDSIDIGRSECNIIPQIEWHGSFRKNSFHYRWWEIIMNFVHFSCKFLQVSMVKEPSLRRRSSNVRCKSLYTKRSPLSCSLLMRLFRALLWNIHTTKLGSNKRFHKQS